MTRIVPSALLRSTRRPSAGGVAALAAALLGATVIAAGPATAAAPAAPALKFTTLNDAADPTFNQLLGINDHSLIVGYFGSGAPGRPNKGYQLTPPYGQGQYHNENFPGSVQTQVVGTNNVGVTVGFWVDAAGNNFGFVERNGVFTSVPHPSAAGTQAITQLLGINDHGVAVGFYNDANGNAHGFTYTVSSKTFRAVTVPGPSSVTATGINNRGDISGFYSSGGSSTGFVLIRGRVRALALGVGGTQALGINQADQVVGSSVDGNGATHGFIWSAKKGSTTVDDPGAVRGPNAMTVVNGLNNRGQAVGFFLDAAGNTDGMLVKGF